MAQKRAKPFDTVEDRLWSKIQCDLETHCWHWTAGLNGSGYGVFNHDKPDGTGVQSLAHRVTYQLLIGPIPKELELDHLCRNHRCVNPDHLEPVTRQENARRGVGHPGGERESHCKRGHPFDEANTYIKPNGAHQCKKCRSATSVAAHRRRRARDLTSESAA